MDLPQALHHPSLSAAMGGLWGSAADGDGKLEPHAGGPVTLMALGIKAPIWGETSLMRVGSFPESVRD